NAAIPVSKTGSRLDHVRTATTSMLTRDSHARGSAGETPFPEGASCVAASSRRRRFEMKPMWRQRLGALAGKTGSAFMDDIGVAGLLCAAAGFADAVGYVNSGVFAANMPGNTVLAGLALAGGRWDIALQRGMTLGAFCVGVVLASFILRLLRE